MFDSLDVVRSVSPEIVVLNKARWMFHFSQSFTGEQKPFCIRLGSWCILSLTDFHRGTEAIQRTSWAVACFISHRVSQRDRSLSAYVLVRGVFYLSQSFTEGQKPFCEQGEHINVCKQTTDNTEFIANVSCKVLCFRLIKSTLQPHPRPLSEWRGEWSPRLPLLRCLRRDRNVDPPRCLLS